MKRRHCTEYSVRHPNYIFTVSVKSLPLRTRNQNSVCLSSHTCQLPASLIILSIIYLQNTVRMLNLLWSLTSSFLPSPVTFSIESKYSPQHLVLKNPEFTFLPQTESKCFSSALKSSYFTHFTFFRFLEKKKITKYYGALE